MKLPARIEVDVEPMSEARWWRVERDLFTKLDAQPLRPGAPTRDRGLVYWKTFTYAATAAAVVALLFALVHPGPAEHWDDHLRLATTDSTSQFSVGESSLTIAPHSLVLVSGDDDRGIDVLLDRGTVTCAVAPRHGRPPFRVDAGEVRVVVVGTKFTVTRDGASTTVDVDEGAVEVTDRGRVTVLHHGEHWPSRAARTTNAITTGLADAAGPPRGDPSAVVDDGRTPTTDRSSSGMTPAARSMARANTRRRRADSSATVDLASNDPPTTDSADSPSEADRAEPPAAPDQASTTPEAPPVAVQPSAQELFEAAARLERTRPDDAAAGYRKIAASHSAWAQIALFALARLEADRGHRTEAVRLFNSYLTRYPHGINADDARELLRRMR